MPIELAPQQLEQLRELENHHELIRQEIERAKSAGLNMADYEAKLQQLEATRQGLLKVYGGSKRRRTVG